MIEKVYAPDGVYAGCIWYERMGAWVAWRAEDRAGRAIPCPSEADARAFLLDRYERFGLAPALRPFRSVVAKRRDVA